MRVEPAPWHHGWVVVLPFDYDADPERYLSNRKWSRDDVHSHVAARLAALGVRRLLDVGAGTGNLTRLAGAFGLQALHLDLSPTMLADAPRPAVRADGGSLPIADGAFDGVAALYTLYHYENPRQPIAEARRVLRRGGVFCACAPDRDNAPELAALMPNWGVASTFDGEEAGDIVESVFDQPGDAVLVEPWDAPVTTLSTVDAVAAYLRCHGIGSDEEATRLASTVSLPYATTHTGCFVYATKG